MASQAPLELSVSDQNNGMATQCVMTYPTLDDALVDIADRFLVNLPDAELTDDSRIFFQIEQAHWYYEDFVREANPKLPSLQLKNFSAMMFKKCPLLRALSREEAFDSFMQYKVRVPVCGAIMINETWDKCILVKGWKSSAGWGFPKGKINENEPTPTCAVREVLEETGYNLVGKIVPDDVIEMTVKEQLVTLFVVGGIPETFNFQTRTRKEISKIEWFSLSDLPTWKRNKIVPGKFYLIHIFVPALKVIVNRHRRALQQSSRLVARIRPSPAGTSPKENSTITNSKADASHVNQSASRPPSPTVEERQVKNESAPESHFSTLLKGLALSATEPRAQHEPDTAQAGSTVPVIDPGPVTSTESSPLSDGDVAWQRAISPSSKRSVSSNGSPGSVIKALDTTSVENACSLDPIPFLSAQMQQAQDQIPRSKVMAPSFGSATLSGEIAPIAVSARHLQQIALLESVAGEAAQILADPEHRSDQLATQPYTQPPFPTNTSHPASGPPTAMRRPQSQMDVLYSTTRVQPQSSAFVPPPAAREDPFQVRPWTSNAFRPPNLHDSMSLAMGVLHPSGPEPSGYRPAENCHPGYPSLLGPTTGVGAIAPYRSPFMDPAMLPRPNIPPLLTFRSSRLHSAAPPRSAPAFAPGFTFPTAPSPQISTDSHSQELLSILKLSPVLTRAPVQRDHSNIPNPQSF